MANKNIFSDAIIADEEFNKKRISQLTSRPNQKTAYGSGLTAEQTQKLFDAPSELLRDKHNKLIELIEPMALNEAERKQSEEARIQAEETRSESERERVEAELVREEKETARNEKVDDLVDLVGKVDTAIDLILSLQESLIGGDV